MIDCTHPPTCPSSSWAIRSHKPDDDFGKFLMYGDLANIINVLIFRRC